MADPTLHEEIDNAILASRIANDFLYGEQQAEEKRKMDEILKDRRKVDEFIIENMRDLRKDIQHARNEISEVKADVQLVSNSLMAHATDEMKLITEIKGKHKDALYGMTEEQHVDKHRLLDQMLEERKNHKEDTRKIMVDTKTKITWAILIAFGLGLLALVDKYIDTNHAQNNHEATAKLVAESVEKALTKHDRTNSQSMRQP